MRSHGQLLEAPRQLDRNVGGKDLCGHARLILALVVEDLVLGNDLPHGQRFLSQDRHGELAAPDEAFEDDGIVVALGLLHGIGQLLHVVGQTQAQRRPAVCRLYDQGKSQPRRRLLRRRPRAHHPIRGRYSRVSKQTLGEVLVHGQNAPRRPAPRVRHRRDLEQGLKRSVLPLASVQRQEEQVGVPDLRGLRERHGVPGLQEIERLLRGGQCEHP